MRCTSLTVVRSSLANSTASFRNVLVRRKPVQQQLAAHEDGAEQLGDVVTQVGSYLQA
jgi:hypothetical protein